MKMKIFILVMLLTSTGIALGQGLNDQAAVLKQIVEHPELQKYYATDQEGNLVKPYIIQYPLRFTDEAVNTLNSESIGIVEQDALPSDAKSWLRFRSMGISAHTASGIANLFYISKESGGTEFLSINFELKKSGSEWQMSNLNVGGR